MGSSPRRSGASLVLFLGVCALCLFLPRMFYGARLAMMELRYASLFLLVCGGFLWVLFKIGRRR